MITRITEEDLDFIETLFNPVAAIECLFSDIESENLAQFDERFCEVRLGQFPLLSYEYLLDDDPNLSSKANFKLREGCGTVYVMGGRKFGKTLITEKIDLCLAGLLLESEKVGFTSFDAIHIRGILEDVIRAYEQHPILKTLQAKVNRHPNYRIVLRSGFIIEGINMNLTGKRPGEQFFQKHLTRLYVEEASFETELIYKKRIDAVSENGCVIRATGMTNFTKYSPAGRIFYDLELQPRIVNLPQYVSPKWDAQEEKDAIKKHSGRQSVSYRVFVKGEVVEEGVSVIDMERVRKHYIEKKVVKHFEISKDTFFNFESELVIERLKNAGNAYIAADIGESAPTEIMIFFEVPTKDGNKYLYTHNITLYNLTDKQQFRIFRFLSESLKGAFIGIDTTDGTGRAIFRSLEEVVPRENMVWVSFSKKIPVGFEKDDKGNVIFKNGLPVYLEEYVSEWSIKRMKYLLYEGRVLLPLDYKLDMQLNSLIAVQSGTRTVYQCVSAEDHLLQAFQCFAIIQWDKEFKESKATHSKKFSKLGAY